MSVYIKWFPLPNNCGACPLRLAWCRERIYMVTRPERCPLVPVPEHGDLIDRDETVKTLAHDYAYAAADMVRDEMPTIIPADTQWPEWRSQILGRPYSVDKEGE